MLGKFVADPVSIQKSLFVDEIPCRVMAYMGNASSRDIQAGDLFYFEGNSQSGASVLYISKIETNRTLQIDALIQRLVDARRSSTWGRVFSPCNASFYLRTYYNIILYAIFLVLLYTRLICTGRQISEGALNITIFGAHHDCASEVGKYRQARPFSGFALDIIRCSDEEYISDDENATPKSAGAKGGRRRLGQRL